MVFNYWKSWVFLQSKQIKSMFLFSWFNEPNKNLKFIFFCRKNICIAAAAAFAVILCITAVLYWILRGPYRSKCRTEAPKVNQNGILQSKQGSTNIECRPDECQLSPLIHASSRPEHGSMPTKKGELNN